MGQRRRKLVTDCVRKLQGAAIDTFLPNPVVAYYDAAIFLDHARQAFDRWNGHAGRNRYCALQRGMINSWTLKALKGGNLSHLSLHCDIGCRCKMYLPVFPGFSSRRYDAVSFVARRPAAWHDRRRKPAAGIGDLASLDEVASRRPVSRFSTRVLPTELMQIPSGTALPQRGGVQAKQIPRQAALRFAT